MRPAFHFSMNCKYKIIPALEIRMQAGNYFDIDFCVTIHTRFGEVTYFSNSHPIFMLLSSSLTRVRFFSKQKSQETAQKLLCA